MPDGVYMPAAGAVFRTREETITRESIVEFASRYDPQAIHMDEAAARAGFFGELIASGWQTAVVTMRLVVELDLLRGTPMVGVEVRSMRFEAPVRPGDVLHAVAEVRHTRTTSGGRGLMTVDVRTFNGDGTLVLTQEWIVLATGDGAGRGA
ncbi:MAG: MaoC/PaaZ C-terminal domain-containing protein [Phycisphaerales bacterium]